MEGKNPQTGTLERWASNEHASTSVSSPVWNEPQIHEPKLPKNRASFLIDQLLSAFTKPVESPAYLAKNAKLEEADRKFGATTLRCLTVKDISPPAFICTDPKSGAVRLDARDTATTVRNQIGTFRAMTVATEISISFGNREAIAGKVVALRGLEPTDSHLATSGDDTPVLRDVQPGQTPQAGVVSGRKIAGNAPSYPSRARENHVSGTVVVGGIIDKTGILGSIIVIANPSPDLTESALDAVRTWRYTPYLLNGKPAEVDTRILINFALNR